MHLCHPHVDSKLGGETSLASMSGSKPTSHRHSLSSARTLPSTGPHARTMPTSPPTMPRARPVRHARPTPTDRVSPSPCAYMITSVPATPQTCLFDAAWTTHAVRIKNLCRVRAEHRRIPTKPHRPTPRHHVVEHHQG